MGTGESLGTGALIGASAVIAGLSLAEFATSLKNGLNNPVVSIGERGIDHVPAGMKAFAIRTFLFDENVNFFRQSPRLLRAQQHFSSCVGLEIAQRNQLKRTSQP